MDFDSISKWLEEHYILVFIVLPGVIAHVMPHLSPEWQAKLGKVGTFLNLLAGNYKGARNAPKVQMAEQVAAAAKQAESA